MHKMKLMAKQANHTVLFTVLRCWPSHGKRNVTVCANIMGHIAKCYTYNPCNNNISCITLVTRDLDTIHENSSKNTGHVMA